MARVRYVNSDADAGGDGTTNATSSGDSTHAYPDMSTWEAQEGGTTDITASGGGGDYPGNHTVYFDGSAADTSNTVFVGGWTTSSTYRIYLLNHSNQPPSSVWSTSKYRLHLSPGNNSLLTMDGNGGAMTHIELNGLQFENSDGGVSPSGALHYNGQNATDLFLMKNNLFKWSGTNTSECTAIDANHQGTHAFVNNGIFGGWPGVGLKLRYTNYASDGEVMNNTIVDCGTYGIQFGTGQWGDQVAYNNLVDRSGTSDYYLTANLDSSGDNFSGDATSPQTGNRNATIFEDLADPGAANADLTLDVDTTYEGTDLSTGTPPAYNFTTDINGVTRVDWDAGLHEVIDTNTYGVVPRRIPRTSKPTQFTKIDNGNPITRGLSFLFAFTETGGSTARNAFSTTDLTLLNGAEFRVGEHGPHLYMDSTNDYAEGTNADGSVEQNAVDGLTVMVKFQMLTHSATSASVIAQERPGNSFAWFLQSTGVTGDYRFGLESGNYSGTITDPATRTTPVWLVAKWNSTDTTQSIYLYDGITGALIDSDTTGTYVGSITWQTAAPDFRIVLNDFSADYDEKNYYFAGAWGRELSLSEVESVIKNEHQLLQPRTKLIPTMAAAEINGVMPRRIYWKKKPDYNVEIDYSNHLAKGLIHAVFFNNGGLLPRDLVQTNPLSFHGAARPDLAISRVGRGLRFVTSNSGIVLKDITLGNRVSVFCISSLEAAPTSEHMLSNHNGWFLTAQSAFTNPCRFAVDTGAEVSVEFGDNPVQHAINAYGGTYNGATIRTFLDGVFKESGVQTGTIAASTNSRIGQYGGGAFPWQGNIYVALVWDRALSDAEHKSIADNPYQVLKPITRLLPVGAAAVVVGGISHNGALVLTKFLSQAQIDQTDFLATITLARTIAQSQVDQVDFNPSIALNKIITMVSAGQGDYEAAITLAKFLGITQTADLSIEATISLVKIITQTQTDQVDFNPTITLNKILTLINTGQGDYEAAIILAKILGVTQTAELSVEATITLTKIITQAQTDQVDFNPAIALNKIITITQADRVDFEPAITLNKVNNVAQTALSDYTPSTPLNRVNTIAQVRGVDYLNAITLARTATIVQTSAITIEAGLSLAVFKGQTQIDQLDATADVTLVRDLAIAPLPGWNTDAALTLGRTAGISMIGQADFVAALTLAITDGISQTAQIAVEAVVSLGKTNNLAQTTTNSYESALLLGKDVVLATVSQAVFEAGLSLSAIKSISFTSSVIRIGLVTPGDRVLSIEALINVLAIEAEGRIRIVEEKD